MRTRGYYQLLFLWVVALSIAIGILSYVLLQSGPRVRIIEADTALESSALSSGSVITVRFDRPVTVKDDLAQLLRFEPELEFKAVLNSQRLDIRIAENVQHSIDYQLYIEPGFYDVADRPMTAERQHTFTAAPASFAYIDRNYGYNSETDSKQMDHIMGARLGQDPEVLYAHPSIRSMTANENYIIVVVADEDHDRVYAIDRLTKEVKLLPIAQLVRGATVNTLAMVARGPQLLFTVSYDAAQVTDLFYLTFNHRLKSLNVETGFEQVLTDESNNSLQVATIELDRDGRVALVQTLVQGFYLVSPYDDYSPVLLGQRLGSYGFNSRGSKVIFNGRDSLFEYDIVSAEVVPRQLDSKEIVQKVSAKNGSIYFSVFRYNGTSILQSAIGRQASWEDPSEFVWEAEVGNRNRLHNFEQSYDDTLLAMQFNPAGCQYDTVGVNSQCQETFSVIYDTKTDSIIQELEGFGVVWLP